MGEEAPEPGSAAATVPFVSEPRVVVARSRWTNRWSWL